MGAKGLPKDFPAHSRGNTHVNRIFAEALTALTETPGQSGVSVHQATEHHRDIGFEIKYFDPRSNSLRVIVKAPERRAQVVYVSVSPEREDEASKYFRKH